MTELFDTESFINKISNEIDLTSYWHIVDKLCKKIDVVKHVYKYYSLDLSSKKSSDEISDPSYSKLLNILINKSNVDFKLLNSGLKLNDIMLSKSLIDNLQNEKNRETILLKIKNILDAG